MKATVTIALVAFLASTSGVLAAGHKPHSPAPVASYKPDVVLVTFDEGAPETAIAAAHSQIGGKETRRYANFPNLKVVKLPKGMSLEDAIHRYRKLPAVKSVEPDYMRHIGGIPDDPGFRSQWGLQNTGQNGGTPGADIHATAAWDLSTGSRGGVVMVIDTGIDYTHQDLADNMWHNPGDCYNDGIDHDGNGYVNDCYGINPVDGNSDPMDYNSHGTHVAGIIGAVGNNNLGVVGVNWQVSLMACKAFDGDEGSDDNIIACLDYALTMKQRGVNIIATNNSYGGAPYSQALHNAIVAQAQNGILFVAEAGHLPLDEDEEDKAYYPANYDAPNVIAVAATGQQDQIYPGSGYGAHTVHLGAPGDFIYSTVPNNGYDLYSGPSMAAAFATGVAALLQAQDPSRDWRAIKNLILTGGDPNQSLSNAFSPTITGKRLSAYGSMTCSNSPLLARFRPTDSGLVTKYILAGSKVEWSVLNINCAAPAGPVSVAVQPGNTSIRLVDDGTGSDVAAGDGLYTATWVPPSAGDYTLSFPDGSTLQVTVFPAYTYYVDTFNWRTITGTNLNLSNNSIATVALPFPINFGGNPYSTVHIDSNGKLNFFLPESDDINVSLPNPYAGYNTVATPWWDALSLNPTGNVYWDVTGTAPQREVVFEWRQVSRAGGCTDPAANITFQVVLSEATNDLVYNYAKTAFGGAPDCTAGDHGAQAEVGLQLKYPSATQYSFDQPSLTDNLALRFTLVE